MIELETGTTLDALARCRQVVMTRTNDVLSDAAAGAPHDGGVAVQSLTGLLMTSLEELKVAEEELREQNSTLHGLRAAVDERVHHYRQIFLHIPAPALVTDMHGTILESNHAAEDLLRREARYLERKPLAALLHPKSRTDFRTRLNLLISSGENRSCCLTINRHGDTPVEVDAAVSIVPELGPTKAGAMFWLFSPRQTAA